MISNLRMKHMVCQQTKKPKTQEIQYLEEVLWKRNLLHIIPVKVNTIILLDYFVELDLGKG